MGEGRTSLGGKPLDVMVMGAKGAVCGGEGSWYAWELARGLGPVSGGSIDIHDEMEGRRGGCGSVEDWGHAVVSGRLMVGVSGCLDLLLWMDESSSYAPRFLFSVLEV